MAELNYVEIELDKPRKLRFTIPALRDLERRRGGEAVSVTEMKARNMSVDALIDLTWAGLKNEDQQITADKVSLLIQKHWIEKGKSFLDLYAEVQKGLKQSGIFSAPGENDEKNGEAGTNPAS